MAIVNWWQSFTVLVVWSSNLITARVNVIRFLLVSLVCCIQDKKSSDFSDYCYVLRHEGTSEGIVKSTRNPMSVRTR
jgi:hypothetical protein